jgi:phage tail sheath protein FI
MISTCEFRLVLSIDTVTEVHAGLTLENVPGRFVVSRLEEGSDLLRASGVPVNTNPLLFPSGSNGLTIPLDTAGSDGALPTETQYVGDDNGPGDRTGIHALTDIDQISIIAAPGVVSQTVQNALISQCETLKDRFAILDPAPAGTSNEAPRLIDIQNQRLNYDTKYAAIYYPRIVVPDPLTGNEKPIAPSGHMAGIYARVDNERGVHKAPANEVIRGINALETLVTKGEQEILNPAPLHINVLRDFRAQGRGMRVWGARVLTSDQSFKYINVRRLFIFIEESIEEGLQDYVFEPNNDELWARVRQSITNFLMRIWRDGALLARTPEEAFFVQCDRTTMTQDDIDNGRLICIVGIAPVKPAEFIIIRIGQFPGGGFVEEL